MAIGDRLTKKKKKKKFSKKYQAFLKYNETPLSYSKTKTCIVQRKFINDCAFLCAHVNDILVYYVKLAILLSVILLTT